MGLKVGFHRVVLWHTTDPNGNTCVDGDDGNGVVYGPDGSTMTNVQRVPHKTPNFPFHFGCCVCEHGIC